MGERDAFGNEAGEDALADAGWREPPASRPAAVAAPPRRRRRLAPKLLGALAPVLVTVGLAAALLPVRMEEERAAAPPSAVPAAPPIPSSGTTVRTADVARSIAAVRAAAGEGARPVLVAIGPQTRSFDVQVRTPEGGLRGFRVDGGQAQQTFDQGTAPARTAYAWSDVDPRAPARLTRRLGGVSSLVLVRTQVVQWVVSAADGTWFADPDGRRPRRP